MNTENLLTFLEQNKIGYQRFDHAPVFTCEAADQELAEAPGQPTKNLFLRDDKGKRHFLVATTNKRQIDLKQLGVILETKLSFASADRLKRYLDLEPGSVTLLGLINDSEHQVEVIIDQPVWEASKVQCHPLVNTITLIIGHEDLARFFSLTEHDYKVIDLPTR